MTFEAVVLICLASSPPRRCQPRVTLHPPEIHEGLPACMRYGMMFAAESGLLRPGETIKVRCRAIRSPGVVA